MYTGTSLIRHQPPLRPYAYGHMGIGGGGFYYERGTPVPRSTIAGKETRM